MDIGKKIYYGKSNGIVIWDKGEMTGDVRETTLEEDKVAMPVLTLISSEELGILQLEYGQYAEQFSSSRGYIINTATLTPEFI